MSSRVLPFEMPLDSESCTDEEASVLADLTARGQGGGTARTVLAALGLGIAAAVAAVAVTGRLSSAHRQEVEDVVSLAAADSCTSGLGNCNATRCCSTPGMTCFAQDARYYAQCRPSCVQGPDPTHWDGDPWSCEVLGAKASGEDPCGDPGMDCRQSKCCRQPGHTCYEKNASWATCKGECIAGGPDWNDVDSYPWSCEKLGATKPGAASWVGSQCATGWDNCIQTGCCQVPGDICYKQTDFFGSCKATCSEPGWSCATVGLRTPLAAPAKGGVMPKWALTDCAGLDQGCQKSKCCIGMDVQCYEKDETWAQCKETCEPGVHADDDNSTWSCRPAGPRAYGVTTKGFPSLYCFSVIRTVGYEPGLLKAQLDVGGGIFACDDFSVLSADATTSIGHVETVQFQGAPIIRSIDNTAGNTWLFVHAWEAVIGLNKWRNHTFTLKVDPDAVLIADRVRAHLFPHVGESMYVVNCPIGDMMYGAVEVFSYHAIREWWLRGHTCGSPNNWGEDKYMTVCMDHLGVSRVHDTSIVADNLCLGSDCGNGAAAAFHPYKDVGSWMTCWNRATAPAALPAPQPQQTQVHILKRL